MVTLKAFTIPITRLLQFKFKINEIIQRSLIHDLYGGNRQSGISASANYPYIFIFSSSTGHRHGYKDSWENESVFSYTGEGQIGDMGFTRGNRALYEHLQKGNRVFLFEYIKKGVVQFKSELEFIDVDYFQGTGSDGKERIALKFFFKRVGEILKYEAEFKKLRSITDEFDSSIINEDEPAKENELPSITERRGLVTSRVGQGAYRKSILHRWRFSCAVTGYTNRDILIASHIVPWKNSTNEERLDVHNGILLSPTYDALFDQSLISFEDNGKIILSDALKKSDYHKIGVTGKEIVQRLSAENCIYLEKHRKGLGE